jgi:spore germination protein KB
LGFEVLARTSEILLPYLLLFLILIYIFALFSGQFDFGELQPVLGEGVQPVIEALPEVIGFPYGEMVVFLMFWHFVDKPQQLRKTAFLAVGLSTVLFIISLVFMISILGPELAGSAEIPLLELILTINIADFITNLDSIAVFIMFIGGFYKTALHFYGCALVLTWIHSRLKLNWIMLILGLLLPIAVHFRFPSFAHQRWFGAEVSSTLNIPLFSCLNVLLLLIILIKKKQKSSSEKENK